MSADAARPHAAALLVGLRIGRTSDERTRLSEEDRVRGIDRGNKSTHRRRHVRHSHTRCLRHDRTQRRRIQSDWSALTWAPAPENSVSASAPPTRIAGFVRAPSHNAFGSMPTRNFLPISVNNVAIPTPISRHDHCLITPREQRNSRYGSCQSLQGVLLLQQSGKICSAQQC